MKKTILYYYFASMIVSLAAFGLEYIGDSACVTCHPKETSQWQGSHHDLAMTVANEQSVKGDFENATFTYNGITSTFYKKENKYMVRTDGADGELSNFKIAYTLGIYPLQQYMVKFPQGRIQVLDIAWDSRLKEEGGQRWYHLHPDENITHESTLHWTGPNLNWNYMCADCHSTNLKKNYNLQTKSYHTSWSSINVSCEACHGPASEHIVWSEERNSTIENRGFPISLQYKKKRWDINATTLKAKLSNHEIEVCAKCHSRRTQLDDNYTPGDNYSDHYLSSLLTEGLYYPDGKIEDEVYVYNSFRQSKMYEKGVSCSDCHNPHTLKRRQEGDRVCFQCHQEGKYSNSMHHKHPKGSKGASCIECHMPTRTYMGVDSRNDHSFRIPRPDLSIGNTRPNACNNCHKDKDAQWASNRLKQWYNKIPIGKQNFSHALESLRENKAEALEKFYEMLLSDAPNIAKATALHHLESYPSQQTYRTLLQMLRDSDEDIRRAGLQALDSFPLQLRLNESFKMLEDRSKIVRMEAARQLASYPIDQLNKKYQTILQKALDEYEKILLFSSDRPESQVALAMLYQSYHHLDKAENAYMEALKLQPKYIPAIINYADFLQRKGDEPKVKKILQEGISKVPNGAVLYKALGLWYIRNKEKKEGLLALKRAYALDSEDMHISYVYAVAVGDKDPQQAIKILEKAYQKHTGNIEIVSGLAYYYKIIGDLEKSSTYEKRVKSIKSFSVK
jgi:Tfp pilus assembly protein PilF